MTNLIITSTEDEFNIRVQVKQPLHDFALVDSDRTDFEILLANEYFDWSLAGEVVLQQILALSALEQAVDTVS
jgi:hypothetical protein